MIEGELTLGWISPTHLTVEGELDVETGAQLIEAVVGQEPPLDRVDLDLAGVTFMDSSGLKALLDLQSRNIAVRLVQMSSRVESVLRLTRVIDLFVTEGDDEIAS